LRGRRGIGLLRPLDLGSTLRIRSAGRRASARGRERLIGGAARADLGRGRLIGGAARAELGRGRLTGGAARAELGRGRLTGRARRQEGGVRGGCSGPSDSRRTAKIRLGLFKKGPSDLRWTAGIRRPASVLFSGQQRWRHPYRGGGARRRQGARGLRGSRGDRDGLGD
jgi:hypothetical protein